MSERVGIETKASVGHETNYAEFSRQLSTGQSFSSFEIPCSTGTG